MYTLKLVLNKTPSQTVSGWLTAATYGFLELAEYHRSDQTVQRIIRNTLAHEKKGLGYLLGLGAQAQCLNNVVKDLAGAYVVLCSTGCGRTSNQDMWGLCATCASKYV